ncbi:DUF255 domain-containing protein [Marinilabiliaceae bacterium JC017]|nr:DUF255 domain-containing protein [Marinilabiliaceae bacterium JC017]
MHKIFSLSVVLLLAVIGANAQKVKFYDLTWEEAMHKAKQENKEIFIDVTQAGRKDAQRDKVYKTIFRKAEVAKYMNAHFVSVKADMMEEKWSGFGPKLEMLMYPCMVFYSAEGSQLHFTNAPSLVSGDDDILAKAKASLEQAKVKRANKRSITFEAADMEAAFKKAKAKNKLIFIDTYTTWCRPCLKMAKDVFTIDEVADYYNENFISLKLDCMKEPGKSLADKYGVKGFPTFLFIDGHGELVHTADGYMEPDKFIEQGKKALENKPGIKFMHGSWDEVKAMARKEKKMIFVDCYTAWCGPCKMLAKDVFPQKAVGEFFNEHFINFKVDMEKGEGIDLKNQFNVSAFPTLVWVDANGKIQHKSVGSLEAEKLIKTGQQVVDGKGLIALEEKYLKDKGNFDGMAEYIYALSVASEQGKIQEVLAEYFDGVKNKDLFEKDNYDLINYYLTDVYAPAFIYFDKKQEKFAEMYKAEDVAKKLYGAYLSYGHSYVKSTSKGPEIDDEGFADYKKMLAKRKVEGREKIIGFVENNMYRERGQWPEFVASIKAMNEKGYYGTPNSFILYNWAFAMTKGGCEDKACLLQGAEWMQQAFDASSWPVKYNIVYLECKLEMLKKAQAETAKVDALTQEIAKLKKQAEEEEKNGQPQSLQMGAM